MSTNSLAMSPGETKRPIGVWFLTIWDAVFVGLVPLFLVGLILFNEKAQSEITPSPTQLAVPILLALSVLLGALLAWRGDRRGRNLLVAAVTIHHCLIAFNNIGLVLYDSPSEVELTRLWADVFRSVFWIAIHLWYFLGNRTKAFYMARDPE